MDNHWLGQMLGYVLAPFIVLLLLSVSTPFTVAVKRWMPNGRLKRLLLYRWGEKSSPWAYLIARAAGRAIRRSIGRRA